jgi:hypothetical protein
MTPFVGKGRRVEGFQSRGNRRGRGYATGEKVKAVGSRRGAVPDAAERAAGSAHGKVS